MRSQDAFFSFVASVDSRRRDGEERVGSRVAVSVGDGERGARVWLAW